MENKIGNFLLPVLVASVIGALVLPMLDKTDQTAATDGAMLGAIVQITVRLLGVS